MNNSGFTQIFDVYIPSMSIKEFIQKGWLAAYQYYSIPNSSEIIKSIESIRDFDLEGDYKISALTQIFDTSKIRAQLYNSYVKNALGKKGIIYSISREHSEHICTQYRRHNIAIENIDSETPAKVRENIIKAFKNGEIDIIVNVDIFSEGFDCPDIEFIQLARPTKSLVKYLQQVGRGLRKNGNKRCIILDNVGLYSRFGLPDEDRDWESFFYGNKVGHSIEKIDSCNNKALKECQNVDLREGNEEMILIQNLDTSQVPEQKNLNQITTQVQRKGKEYHFTITSKCFNSGKYIIEENEEGFFIVNKRTNKRMFLTEMKTMHGGVIVIKKEHQKDSFVIIKALLLNDIYAASSRIVGFLSKEGLIMKFTSFDKSVINKNIIV